MCFGLSCAVSRAVISDSELDGFSGVGSQEPAGRRFRLRAVTAESHTRLEAATGAGEKPDGVFASVPAYLRYLHVMHSVRARLEADLDSAGAAGVFARWPDRKIALVLADDIRDLGGVPAVPHKPDPHEAGAAAPMSAGAMLGVLYVLEGSSLGARLLSRLASAAGLGPEFGARHLFAQASDPQAWRDYVAILDTAVLSEVEEAECERAASRTFEEFAEAFAAVDAAAP